MGAIHKSVYLVYNYSYIVSFVVLLEFKKVYNYLSDSRTFYEKIQNIFEPTSKQQKQCNIAIV